jgi:hypothetical protein
MGKIKKKTTTNKPTTNKPRSGRGGLTSKSASSDLAQEPRPISYDCDYYYNLLRIQSSTAKLIADIRWNFIKEIKPNTILDFGCGCSFFKAFAPPNVQVDTYDIMPVPATGITREEYDVVCFFDCLEHVDWANAPDKKMEEAFQMGKHIFITVPILPMGKSFRTWKHRKPGEHLHRFVTYDAVIYFFTKRGLKLVKAGMPECPPREDITSFLFKKICKN